ncbi:hypothetical protein M0R04_06880 [Candidatus Dojkabacteria bacterium]|jgi:hypothetical protein|nr:hypothetical protein [Candidatus Dojkabacteria bacterium]
MAYQKKKKQENSNTISSPEELKKFKQILVTITHYMQIVDDQREAIKDTIDEAAGEYGVDKKYIRKLAKVLFKHNYADIQEENSHFEFLYEALVGGRLIASDPLEDSE